MTMILGIYGSPRKGGNTDRLLDRAMDGAESAGAAARRVYARDLRMSGCLECGGCDNTGICVVRDDMQAVYPLLEEAGAIILASPIFFYALTAQAKAVVDRSQAMWSRRLLGTGDRPAKGSGGKGYLIAVGATRGRRLFDCVTLEARYFFDALGMQYGGELLFRDLEKRADVEKHPEKLEQAFELGRRAAE